MLGDTWLGRLDDSVSEEFAIVTLGAGDGQTDGWYRALQVDIKNLKNYLDEIKYTT